MFNDDSPMFSKQHKHIFGKSAKQKRKSYHKYGKIRTTITKIDVFYNPQKRQESTTKHQNNHLSTDYKQNEPITCVGLFIVLKS